MRGGISLCFVLNFLGSDVEHLFMDLLSILMFTLKKCLFRFFVHLIVRWVFVVFVLDLLNYMYIYILVFWVLHPQPMEVPRLRVNWSCWPTRQSQQHDIWAMSATYTTTHNNAGSLNHWVWPGIKPTTSWMLVRFVTTEPWWELLFICFGLNFIHYMVCKIFSHSFCRLTFHFVNCFLCYAEAFDFDVVLFIDFSFVVCTICVTKKLLLKPILRSFFPTLFSGSFTISSLCLSFDPFWVNFCE